MNFATTLKSILVAATPKSPGPKTLPKGLTTQATSMWPEFWKKYGRTVKANAKANDPEYVWKVALAIFRNYCSKRNIPIFAESKSILKEDRDYMRNRLQSNHNKLQQKALSVLKSLKAQELVKRSTKEVLKPIVYAEGMWCVPTELKCVLSQPYSKLKVAVKKLGFNPDKKSFVYTQGSHVLAVNPGEDDFSCTLRLELWFTQEHVKYMVSATAEEPKLIARELGVLVKKYLKKSAVTYSQVIAAVDVTALKGVNGYDFNKELPEESMGIIQNIVDTLESCDQASTVYSLQYIQSLGDPLYQYNLVKALVAKYPECNTLWADIVAHPEDYLMTKPVENEEDDI